MHGPMFIKFRYNICFNIFLSKKNSETYYRTCSQLVM